MTELYTTIYYLTIIVWIVWGIVAVAFIFAGCLILYELLIMPICEYLEKKRKRKMKNRYYRYFSKKNFGLIKNVLYDLLNKILGFSPSKICCLKFSDEIKKTKRI